MFGNMMKMFKGEDALGTIGAISCGGISATVIGIISAILGAITGGLVCLPGDFFAPIWMCLLPPWSVMGAFAGGTTAGILTGLSAGGIGAIIGGGLGIIGDIVASALAVCCCGTGALAAICTPILGAGGIAGALCALCTGVPISGALCAGVPTLSALCAGVPILGTLCAGVPILGTLCAGVPILGTLFAGVPILGVLGVGGLGSMALCGLLATVLAPIGMMVTTIPMMFMRIPMMFMGGMY